jgi:hypothetical protein
MAINGTDATTNFIGTIDDQALIFKVKNVFSGFINRTHGNTAFGYTTMLPNISGTANTAIGSGALFFKCHRFNNSANGLNALSANTSGGENTANGYTALSSNTGVVVILRLAAARLSKITPALTIQRSDTWQTWASPTSQTQLQ